MTQHRVQDVEALCSSGSNSFRTAKEVLVFKPEPSPVGRDSAKCESVTKTAEKQEM